MWFGASFLTSLNTSWFTCNEGDNICSQFCIPWLSGNCTILFPFYYLLLSLSLSFVPSNVGLLKSHTLGFSVCISTSSLGSNLACSHVSTHSTSILPPFQSHAGRFHVDTLPRHLKFNKCKAEFVVLSLNYLLALEWIVLLNRAANLTNSKLPSHL